MFDGLRKRLLHKYMLIQGIMFLFVFVFMYAVYVGSVYNNQYEQVELFAYEEAEEYWYILRGDVKPMEQELVQPDSAGHNFCYAYDRTGSELAFHAPRRPLADGIAAYMLSEELPADAVRLFFAAGEADNIMPRLYLVTKRELYDDKGYIGRLCAGRDVSLELYQVAQAGLFMLALMVGIMLLIYRLSLIMVEEAMKPIMQALEQQRSFTADASHELRTPLSVMMASLDCIKRDKATRMSEFSQEVLGDMNAEIDRMRLLVENLLMLARSDNNVSPAEPEIIDIASISRAKCRSFARLAEEKKLTMQTAGLENSAVIMADAQQFAQIVAILLDNAIKYTPPGGHISVSLTRRGTTLVLAVSDTGCGIDEADREKIFKRFYRSDKARSFNGGAGLGLSIASLLAAANHLKITVDSEAGRGSCFKVTMQEYDIPDSNVE